MELDRANPGRHDLQARRPSTLIGNSSAITTAETVGAYAAG
jgi:hypothetical protein